MNQIIWEERDALSFRLWFNGPPIEFLKNYMSDHRQMETTINSLFFKKQLLVIKEYFYYFLDSSIETNKLL
jgi:hypothetical protein